MPDAAEVEALVLQLLHLDDLGEALDALHERVLDRLAHAARERHELRRRQRLVAEEDDLVLEQGLANLFRGNFPREIHPEDLRAERARDASDLQTPIRP